MSKSKNEIISVQGAAINIVQHNHDDYISLTDMAKAGASESRAADVIKNWMRNRTTLEFLGTWEELYNPDFKVVEFDHFKMQAGLHTFTLSPGMWVEKTNAIGVYVLIRQNLPQSERLVVLNQTAITQLTSLLANEHIKKLSAGG